MLEQQTNTFLDGIVTWFRLANSIPRQKRALFMVMMLLGAGLLFFDLVFAAPLGNDTPLNVLNVAMMLVLGIAALVFWRRVKRQELLLLFLFLLATAYLVAVMTYKALQVPLTALPLEHTPHLAPWLIWLMVMQVGCFYTFRAAIALRLTLLMAAIAFSGAIALWIQRIPTGIAFAHDLFAFALANALLILFMYRLTREQEHSSQTDFLTRLPNRLHGYSALEYEIERAARYHNMFVVILFDIDHFKKINDTYGHPAGDAVLRDFAGFAQQHIRRTDILTRWGGEEFLLLMPETDLASGRLKADHLRMQIRNRAFYKGIRVTCSFGVTAFYPRDTTNTLLERADAALYRAKANGRNCVETE